MEKLEAQHAPMLRGKSWEVPVITINLISGILAVICGKIYLP